MSLIPNGVLPRRDRAAATLAAIVALLLFVASTAQAAPVEFTIDITKSTLQQVTKIDASAAKLGKFTSVPQVGVAGSGSDTAPIWGSVWADLTSSTIKLMGGSSLNFITTGNYTPFDPVTSNPLSPPNSGKMPGNFGFKITGLPNLNANLHDLRADFAGIPSGLLPGSPGLQDMPLSGGPTGTFNMFGVGLLATEGRLAIVSSFGNTTEGFDGTLPTSTDTNSLIAALVGGSITVNLSPPPTVVGTGDVGNWDGTTLTIPINSSVTIPTVIDIGGTPTQILITSISTGVIVATPRVPEPSTLTLLGCGLAGLMSYAWRVRKRKGRFI